jgi:hypothetical protein
MKRVIGNRPPLLGGTAKRAIASALLSIPAALLAFTVADRAPVPYWLRLLISPGVLVGFRFAQPQPCGGLLDCLVQIMGTYAKGAEIACVINATLYGLLIFGVTTTLSASSRTGD